MHSYLMGYDNHLVSDGLGMNGDDSGTTITFEEIRALGTLQGVIFY